MAEHKKYRVVILGRLAEGADADKAGQSLARLFDVSPQRVARLLEGKRVPVRKELAHEDAQKLRERLAAVGVPSEVEPVEELSLDLEAASQGASQTTEEGEDMAVTEIEATAVGGFSGGLERRTEQARAAELDLEGSPAAAPEPSRREEAGESDGGHEVFVDARMASGWPGAQSAASASAEKRVGRPLVLVFLAVLALALAGGGVYLWLDGGEQVPTAPVARESGQAPPGSATGAPGSEAERRLYELVRSVKVWMIQFGVGYDPTQVTLSRLRSDMGITDGQLEDPWGTEMRYRASSDAFEVVSAGPDRRFGTADDLSVEGRL